jgi:hypothetical protein
MRTIYRASPAAALPIRAQPTMANRASAAGKPVGLGVGSEDSPVHHYRSSKVALIAAATQTTAATSMAP